MSLKLYEYTENYQNLARLIEDNPEMETEDILEAIDNIQESSHEKIGNTAGFIKKLEDDVTLIKKRKSELNDVQKRAENTIASLKDYLLFNMQKMEMKKVDTGTRVVSIRNNAPKLIVKNIDKVPAEYKTYKTTLEVDKEKLPKKWKSLLIDDEVKVITNELRKLVKSLDESKDLSYKEYADLQENPSVNIK